MKDEIHLLRRLLATVIALSLVLAISSGPVLAQSKSIERGRLLAQRDCGMCHAVDVDDNSANPDAPALRDLRLQLSPDLLSQLLSAGMLSGHPHMPDFRLTDEDYTDLVHYLNQLQPPTPPGAHGR